MRKSVTFAVAMISALAMGTTAFAAEGNANLGNVKEQNIDVAAMYSGGVATPTVYSVDLSWGAMEFTYSVGGTKDWQPATHEYEDNSTAQWVAKGNEVTVVNHSNTGVTAGFKFAPLAQYDAIAGSFDQENIILPSAEGKAVDASELVGKAALTIDGTLDSSVSDLTKVGTITVTIK